MDTENIDLIVGSLFILFIIAGMVVTTIVSIIMRKREFGIKMVLGESKFGMLIQIVLENICIAIVGMFLSIVYFYGDTRIIYKFRRTLIRRPYAK